MIEPWQWLLISLAASPLLLVVGVCALLWLNMRVARSFDRREVRDEHQERVFAAYQRASWGGRTRWLWAEAIWQTHAWLSQLRHTVWRFRFPEPQPGQGPVVLLVHGYLENGGTMTSLGRALRRAGYQPVLLDLPTLPPVGVGVERIREAVAALRARLGDVEIGYVGHSLGGVMGRAYTRAVTDHGLVVVISLASPHRGTHIARFGLGQGARDLCVGSEFMGGNHPAERVDAPVPVHTMISAADNIVSPAWSSILGEGEDVLLPMPLGHTGLLYERGARAKVITWLQAALGSPPSVGAARGAPPVEESRQAPGDPQLAGELAQRAGGSSSSQGSASG